MNTFHRIAFTTLSVLTVAAAGCDAGQMPDSSVIPENFLTEQRRQQPAQAAYRPDLFPEQAAIPFGESIMHPLEPASSPSGAKLIQSFPLADTKAEIRIYSDTDASSNLTGYLKGLQTEWKLGSLSAAAPGQVRITPLNWIAGEWTGAEIASTSDSAAAKKRLAVYHQPTDSWKVIDFQGHGAMAADLDGDGVTEWVGNQTDWVPPAVEIHRWNQERGRFESTVVQLDPGLFPDMAGDTPSYSSLFEEEGKAFIEIGDDDAYAFFTYDRGMLKKYRPADTRDRVLEMQMKRSH
ncbi:hypothetical protein SK3146_03050 [Paenibacillus konkukensis]|uniref:Uncharacterized protein n=1 Tax=Paenibacillus konkukensis TaxID=2020716 RepID=A0ABY4RNX9_9BACL|nr:hypothetical protein [Paenibacillus konkukensis]UQZ83843.1 hypothetical protein SK3146_03050 [Paenibacillus konkukensis]